MIIRQSDMFCHLSAGSQYTCTCKLYICMWDISLSYSCSYMYVSCKFVLWFYVGIFQCIYIHLNIVQLLWWVWRRSSTRSQRMWVWLRCVLLCVVPQSRAQLPSHLLLSSQLLTKLQVTLHLSTYYGIMAPHATASLHVNLPVKLGPPCTMPLTWRALVKMNIP